MNAPTESRLLRLAIAKGLLAWEDLDAVADRLPTPGGDVPAERLWIQALVVPCASSEVRRGNETSYRPALELSSST